MVQTRMLNEAQLGAYVEALRAASKGSKIASKQEEFAIIAVGVTQGWDLARQLYESGGHALTADAPKGWKILPRTHPAAIDRDVLTVRLKRLAELRRDI